MKFYVGQKMIEKLWLRSGGIQEREITVTDVNYNSGRSCLLCKECVNTNKCSVLITTDKSFGLICPFRDVPKNLSPPWVIYLKREMVALAPINKCGEI